MSALSSVSLGGGTPAPAGALPLTDAALEPEVIRAGGQTAKNAYQEGLAFENILVNELSQQLTQTVPGLDGSGGDGLGGTAASSDGGGLDGSGSGSGLGAYSSLLPGALTQGIMGGGDSTGIAMQIARAIDPAIGEPRK